MNDESESNRTLPQDGDEEPIVYAVGKTDAAGASRAASSWSPPALGPPRRLRRLRRAEPDTDPAPRQTSPDTGRQTAATRRPPPAVM